MKSLAWLLGRKPARPEPAVVADEEPAYVVAGDFAQFASYVRTRYRSGCPHLCVAQPADLLGLKSPRVLFVGTCYQRADFPEIEAACRECRARIEYGD